MLADSYPLDGGAEVAGVTSIGCGGAVLTVVGG